MKSESLQNLINDEQIHLWDAFFTRTYRLIRHLVFFLAMAVVLLVFFSGMLLMQWKNLRT